MKQRREAKRRREAPQHDADWWVYANTMLVSRCGGRCERCNEPLTRDHVERHHRKRRRDGGDRLCNIALLHPECHRYVTEHPAESVESGWIVPTYADPEMTPMLTGDVWWLLDDFGVRTRVPLTDAPTPSTEPR